MCTLAFAFPKPGWMIKCWELSRYSVFRYDKDHAALGKATDRGFSIAVKSPFHAQSIFSSPLSHTACISPQSSTQRASARNSLIDYQKSPIFLLHPYPIISSLMHLHERLCRCYLNFFKSIGAPRWARSTGAATISAESTPKWPKGFTYWVHLVL